MKFIKIGYACACACACALTVLWGLVIVTVTGLQKPFSPRYPPLRHYPSVDPRLVSVSGFSNGAAFAVQLTFIYSSLFSGCGVFSGYPYPMAEVVAGGKVSEVFKMRAYYPIIEAWAAEGAIDPVTNLRGTKVYAYIGLFDFNVPLPGMKNVVEQLSHYGADVRNRIKWTRGAHCVPTDNFPPTGDYLPFIGSMGGVCNTGYQGVNDMFSHFYGSDFVAPAVNNGTPQGSLFKYDQNEFFDDDFAEGNGFNPTAYAYVPPTCGAAAWGRGGRGAPCKLHVALHGALVSTGARIFSDGFTEFVNVAGYLQAADANNVIVIFPEASAVNVAAFDLFGIWSTRSATTARMKSITSFWSKKTGWGRRALRIWSFYKNGTHAQAVRRMVDRILGRQWS